VKAVNHNDVSNESQHTAAVTTNNMRSTSLHIAHWNICKSQAG